MFGRSSKPLDQEPLDTSAPHTKDITIESVAIAHSNLKILDLQFISKPIADINDLRLIDYIRKVRADRQCADNLMSYYTYTTGKTVANAGVAIANKGLTTAGFFVKDASLMVYATTTGAVIGTAGAAIIVGGAVIMVGGAIQAGVSHHKTNKHIKALSIIMNHYKMLNTQGFGKYQGIASKCNCHDEDSHYYSKENKTQCQFIVSHVLPYIIKQKEKKLHHKKWHMSVIGAPLETGRGIGNYLRKKYKGTQGEGRNQMAMFLTRQHLTTYCVVTDKIMSQLLSSEESLGMRSLSQQKSSADTATVVSEIICRKLACT